MIQRQKSRGTRQTDLYLMNESSQFSTVSSLPSKMFRPFSADMTLSKATALRWHSHNSFSAFIIHKIELIILSIDISPASFHDLAQILWECFDLDLALVMYLVPSCVMRACLPSWARHDFKSMSRLCNLLYGSCSETRLGIAPSKQVLEQRHFCRFVRVKNTQTISAVGVHHVAPEFKHLCCDWVDVWGVGWCASCGFFSAVPGSVSMFVYMNGRRWIQQLHFDACTHQLDEISLFTICHSALSPLHGCLWCSCRDLWPRKPQVFDPCWADSLMELSWCQGCHPAAFCIKMRQ